MALPIAASELFLVPSFSSDVKGFELGINHRVSVYVQTELHQVWERLVRICDLFLWELAINRTFQARILTLNFLHCLIWPAETFRILTFSSLSWQEEGQQLHGDCTTTSGLCKYLSSII